MAQRRDGTRALPCGSVLWLTAACAPSQAAGESVPRVVLLFDLWHPELVQAERESIVAMFNEARSKGWMS